MKNKFSTAQILALVFGIAAMVSIFLSKPFYITSGLLNLSILFNGIMHIQISSRTEGKSNKYLGYFLVAISIICFVIMFLRML